MNRRWKRSAHPITPNDEFFVRYHLADIPEIDAKTYKIKVGGDGADTPIETHARRSEEECRRSKSSQSISAPATAVDCRSRMCVGVEWGYGAMGCARWKGARLKDVLDKAGLKKEAIEVSFNGADGPAVDKTPDFIKSIPVVEGDR